MRELLHAVAFEPADIALYDRFSVADLIGAWPPMLQSFFAALAHSGFFGETHEVSLAAFFAGLSLYAISDKRDSGFDVLDRASDEALLLPLARVVESAGGRVLLGTRAERIEIDARSHEARATAVHVRDEAGTARIEASAVVLALDPPGMRALAGADPRLMTALGLDGRTIPRGMPSTVVRLWYDREPPMERASAGVFAAMEADNFFWLHRLQGSFAEWKTATGGGVVECHLYGRRAREAGSLDENVITARVAASVERAWPRVAGGLRFAHVRRNAATHVAFEPGTYATLPDVTTRAPNVALAGDWIRAPWEVLYMERACVTGIVAARTLAAELALDSAAIPELLAPFPASASVARLRPFVRAMRSRGLLPVLDLAPV